MNGCTRSDLCIRQVGPSKRMTGMMNPIQSAAPHAQSRYGGEGYETVVVSSGDARDFLALLKPRVMSLVVFTALTGMVVAQGAIHPVLAFAALLAIAVGAGASGCLNMWYDADIDAVMSRTAKRPIPAGRISPSEALAFGMTLSVGSVLCLGLVANWLAAGLLAFTIFFYAVIYSMWKKMVNARSPAA